MDQSSTVSLNRLLSRLDRTLLSPTDEQLHRLRSSPYERNKVSTNIDHARTILLTAEKQASGIRVQSERQRVQQDLHEKRELIKRLTSRLDELNQLGDEDDDDEEAQDETEDQTNGDEGSDSDSSQQRQPSYAPARSDAQDGIETTGGGGEATAAHAQLSSTLQSELRSRKPPSASDNHTAASTTAREALFSSRPQQATPDVSNSESLLSHNRTEQENLTTGLLSLARALKESSLNFSSSLESEKDVLKRAEGGLDKSAQGMEAAERKMGALRRISEGQGWWGRIKLYGMIFGLWLACFLFVFVGPKLRF